MLINNLYLVRLRCNLEGNSDDFEETVLVWAESKMYAELEAMEHYNNSENDATLINATAVPALGKMVR